MPFCANLRALAEIVLLYARRILLTARQYARTMYVGPQFSRPKGNKPMRTFKLKSPVSDMPVAASILERTAKSVHAPRVIDALLCGAMLAISLARPIAYLATKR